MFANDTDREPNTLTDQTRVAIAINIIAPDRATAAPRIPKS